MSDWTAGYVADIGYTHGYYNELNPLRLKLAFLNQGLVFPDAGNACELGFGQGLSTNFHAAASPTQWHGTDFNPAQAAFAQELAAVSGAGARLYDQAFADFANRADLPDFDYIALHGIWSWISDENRRVIVDFVRKKLKVGGVLYISYNTQPGWAAMVPMRELLNQHCQVMSANGQGIVSRIDSALDFAEQMFATNPRYAQANPQIAERIKAMKAQNRSYLAHEYFNRDWLPMSFANMADWLEDAKLQYACSAHYSDHIDAVNLTAKQQTFLAEIPDRMFRESLRDFMCATQFRRDYWVKGARHLSALEKSEQLRQQRVILLSNRANVPLQVKGALGEANLNEAIYTPILDLLAEHKVTTLGQLEQALQAKGLNFAQIIQAVILLTANGHLAPAQDPAVSNRCKRQSDKLNAHLWQQARSNNDIAYSASPVTGGGIAVNRFQQLFLLARSQGKKQAGEWAQSAWQILAAQGQKLLKDGKALDTPEANQAELTAQAQEFADQHLAVLKALQIA